MEKKFKKVSIVIPVYNEQPTIEKILQAVYKADTLSLKKEIIVVDDFSKDGTRDKLQRYSGVKPYTILLQDVHRGKGACLKVGFLQTKGDIVIVQDADLEYSPKDYPSLLTPILEGYADVVYGSRFVNASPHRVLYFYHFLANKFLTTLSNCFTNLNLSDIETGYKVFKGSLIREVAPNLRTKEFGFEPEITARLAKIHNIKIYEVGISYFGRTYEEGKKINWVDGVKAVYEIIRYSMFT